MKATLLLVTWIVAGHNPASYQVQFLTTDACEAARVAILKDADRVAKALLLPNGAQDAPAGFKADAERTPLVVSAVCATLGAN